MAVRVTSAEVIEIMDGCTISTTIIDNIIIAASALVDKVFAGDGTMTDTLLKEVERWLAAHMIATGPQRSTATVTEEIGAAKVTYTGKYWKMLESTPYGQMVLTLDVTGKMAKTGKMGASIFAVPNFTD